jgi:hypothetical protein
MPDQLIFDKLVQVSFFGAPADEWAGVNAGAAAGGPGLRPGEQDCPAQERAPASASRTLVCSARCGCRRRPAAGVSP